MLISYLLFFTDALSSLAKFPVEQKSVGHQ